MQQNAGKPSTKQDLFFTETLVIKHLLDNLKIIKKYLKEKRAIKPNLSWDSTMGLKSELKMKITFQILICVETANHQEQTVFTQEF